ncbi:MAG: hypothetical protein IJH62_02555 [Mogibacterium sp.]|nr:hypothetical protein [Mogibacterium sp.]
MLVRLAGIEDMEGVKALLRKYHRDIIPDYEFGGNRYLLMGIRTDAADKLRGTI